MQLFSLFKEKGQGRLAAQPPLRLLTLVPGYPAKATVLLTMVLQRTKPVLQYTPSLILVTVYHDGKTLMYPKVSTSFL